MNDVGAHDTQAARTVSTVLTSVGLGIATVTAALCIWLSVQRRELARMTIYRVILALQVLMVLKSIAELTAPKVDSGAACRVYVFFNLVLDIAPLNLSVFALVYFQSVLLHNVQLHARAPRLLLATATTLVSIVPPIAVLAVPARTAGMKSFCQYHNTPQRRHFVFQWLVFYIWVTVTTVIGIYSIVHVIGAIIRRSHKTCEQMAEGSEPSNTSLCNVAVDVTREVRRRRRRSSNLVVVRTLSSIIWFPIAPIISLGFNTVYSIVWYRTQSQSYEVFLVDRVLQFLAVPLVAMTFYLSPPARRALCRYMSDHHRKSSVDTLRSDDLPPCMFDDAKIRDFCQAMNGRQLESGKQESRENKNSNSNNSNSNSNCSSASDSASPTDSLATLYSSQPVDRSR